MAVLSHLLEETELFLVEPDEFLHPTDFLSERITEYPALESVVVCR